ncbi:NAD-dependent epimerase/dehydratase family protein [Pelagibacteraceae bacterium]|nr:NAD-dependent epimerase/dehydratase family protein [Pelagibacteraceae bacterium]
MRNILVTGGAGFIASNLIEHILEKDKKCFIYSIDNYSTGTKKNHIISKRVMYLKGDVIKINNNKKINKINFHIVYHFAEFSRIVPSFRRYEECWYTNSRGTFEIIKLCLKNKAKLIYSASSSTIGNNKYLSPYSWTKYANEETIKNFSKWFNLKYILVYFYNVYGPRQIRDGHMSAVIGIFEKQFLENKPLTIVKPGSQKRDFTHVKDIVEGTYIAAKRHNNKEFHLGSGINYTIKEVAKMFKHKIKYVPERPGERFTSKSKTNIARKLLKYKTKQNLNKYIENFIKNRK